jgi:acyl-CoA synthetase (NDP forming)
MTHQPSGLGRLSQAQSVAVIGASDTPGKLGNVVLSTLIEAPFAGDLFAVHPKADQVLGVPAFPSVKHIPPSCDYAVVIVPPQQLESVIRDCAESGVGIVQILTSGGDDTQAPSRILRCIAGTTTRLMGPNCIGSYVPKRGIGWTSLASFRPGGAAVVSQSGGLSYDLMLGGEQEGVGYSHVLSVGNCIDLDIPDFVAHLRMDDSTDAIGLYVESVGDGRRLYEELRATTALKPVFILKGGRSFAGASSVVSHTGRLAGEYNLWRVMARQAGCTLVDTSSELLACLSGVASLGGASEPRRFSVGAHLAVAMIGNGGGATVLGCDAIAERGGGLAELRADTRARLRSLTSETGDAADNIPVDLPLPRLLTSDGELLANLAQLLADDPGVRTLMVHMNLLPLSSRPQADAMLRSAITRLSETPLDAVENLCFVFRSDGSPRVEGLRRLARDIMLERVGAPVFRTIDDAVMAMSSISRPNRSGVE